LTQHSSQSIVARIARENTPFANLVRKSLKRGRLASVEVIEATNEQIFNRIQNEFVINNLIDRHPNIVMVEKVAI
jgi:hypothetical protein